MIATPILPKGRVLVVGDIHGCFNTLIKLLKKVKYSAKDVLYQTGDLIDRGADSKRVVDYAMAQTAQKRMIVLRGNHEQMLLDALGNPNDELHWLKSGGAETLNSFGVESVHEIPKKYINWFKRLPLIVTLPYEDGKDYVISHAGVNKQHKKPFRETDTNANYVLWNRNKAKKHKTIVNIVGHTPKSISEIRRSLKTGTIYIDGACAYGDNLIALDLDALTITAVKNCEDS